MRICFSKSLRPCCISEVRGPDHRSQVRADDQGLLLKPDKRAEADECLPMDGLGNADSPCCCDPQVSKWLSPCWGSSPLRVVFLRIFRNLQRCVRIAVVA